MDKNPRVVAALLDKRFLVVAGKGGVGKSTVAAALALSASRRGKRVLVAELACKEKVAGLLGHTGAINYHVTRVRENIDVVNVTPEHALHEYGVMKLRYERLYRAVFENPVMKSLTRMIPGMNELVLIGKAWHLEQEKDASGRPRWDLIIVDAPATGHGVSLLLLPHVITETVKSGPMYEETALIRDLLVDPERTAMNIVSLPEEMPVNETLELRRQMDDSLRIAPGHLFVNAVWPAAPSTAGLERLSAYHERVAGQDARIDGLLDTTRFMVRRANAQQRHLTTLRERANMDQVEIPYIFTDLFGFDAIDQISRHIDSQGA